MAIAFDLKRALPAAAGLFAAALPAAAEPVTFYRDVLPILQNSCQECHRPGEVGPMPLMTYEQARKAAPRIGEALTIGKMPPWYADPGVVHFANDRTLSTDQIARMMAWIDSGAPAGNPKDAPPPRAFAEGWQIGTPDLVVELPNAYPVPAHGTLEYQFVVVPLHFTEDKWVQAFEVRPSNPAVVHHATAVVRGPGSAWLAEVPPGTFRPKRGDTVDPTGLSMSSGSLGAYTPGQPPVQYKPGRAMLVRAGSDLVLEMHYTPNGKAATDRTRVGFIFARERPAEMVRRFTLVNTRFEIPPGVASWRVDATTTIKTDMKLVALHAHMHLRGKAAEFRAVLPNGEAKPLLKISRYDPMWQLRYVLADELDLKFGTRIDASWWFDNSRHRYNPDPTATVRWGDQNWEEMALAGFEVVVPLGSQTRGGLISRSLR
jgi:Copper type II ascorbate-dependent monooxygenase, C-terminal domain